MPLIEYTPYKPTDAAVRLIRLCNEILTEYEEQGYSLTLRQLYYQLVARDVIPNTQKSYNNVGSIVTRAREAGMIDWHHIEDRTRRVRGFAHWQDGNDFLTSVVKQFSLDYWLGQPQRCIVFVEKEALEQIVGRAADAFDCPYLANKGYLSASAVWDVAHNRMLHHDDRTCDRWVVLHLGDHDPSGIDMSRDIADRLRNFARPTQDDQRRISVEVRRIALNMDQIEQYEPPPNPAKQTDSRFEAYEAEYGTESWELDALEPSVIDTLIRSEIEGCIEDVGQFRRRQALERRTRKKLEALKVE